MIKYKKIKNLLLVIILMISFISYNVSTFAFTDRICNNANLTIYGNPENDNEVSEIICSFYSGGSSWRVRDNGTLYIDGGNFHHRNNFDIYTWYFVQNEHNIDVTRIVVNDKITASGDQNYLFYGLYSVTIIEGLELIDMAGVTSLQEAFAYMFSLTELDLSSFNTENVTNMSGMFSNMSSLTKLNLSSFDTSNVTDMSDMFVGTNNLRELTLGEHFSFDGSESLPEPSTTLPFTGEWQHIDNENLRFTSAELMEEYDGSTMAGTFVWRTISYTTKVRVVGNGEATADKTTDVIEGGTINLTATPEEGNYFKGWVVVRGDVELSDPTELTTTFTNNGADVEVIAVFDSNENSQLRANYLYTANDFTIGVSEVAGLSDEIIIEKANLVVADVITNTPVEMEVLENNITSEVGTYPVTFSNTDETISIEIAVTVVVNNPDTNEETGINDNNNNNNNNNNNTNNNNQTTPQTGDVNNLFTTLGILIISISSIVLVLLNKKKSLFKN